MDSLAQMAGRPGTPSRERVMLADQLIKEDLKRAGEPGYQTPWEIPGELNATHQDVRMLLDYTAIRLFSMTAYAEPGELIEAEQIQDNKDLLTLVSKGSNDRFIGILIDLGEPTPEDTPDQEKERGVFITCLYRNPEWVGMNELLEWCRDLEVHVFSYHDQPQEPCIILAVRPG